MVPPSLHQLIRTWKEATTPNLSPLRQLENSKRTFSVLTNFPNYYRQPPSTAINLHHRNNWEMVPPSLHQLIRIWKEATTPNLSPLRQLENSRRKFSVLTNFLNDYGLPPSTAITKPLGNCTAITSLADQDVKRSYQTKSQPSTTITEFKTGFLSFN